MQNFNPQMPPSMDAQGAQMSPLGAQPAQPAGNMGQMNGMDLGRIMEFIKTLPPAEQEQYLAQISQDYAGKSSALDEQMASANALRDAPPVNGQVVNGVLVGGGGLEGVARGIGMYKGGKEAKRIAEERKGLSADKEAGIQGAMAAILRGA